MTTLVDLDEYTRLQDDGCPNCEMHIGDVVYVYDNPFNLALESFFLPLMFSDFNSRLPENIKEIWLGIDKVIMDRARESLKNLNRDNPFGEQK